MRRADHSSRGVLPSIVCLIESEYHQCRCIGPLVAVEVRENKRYTMNSLTHANSVCTSTARIQRHGFGEPKQIDVFHIAEFSSPSRHTMCISTRVTDISVICGEILRTLQLTASICWSVNTDINVHEERKDIISILVTFLNRCFVYTPLVRSTRSN
jgi:hypothetical protein